ncbi:MAG: D-amino acid dehydrogenase [Cardiobacteriaceae bacterium]|nr:D-amino acid dehydrogenase [Cardiobacteriaceae bacterium]
MHIIILGSGVVGISTAWYLLKQGHQVTIIDRQASAAEETSKANAGQLSYGYTTPWAAPNIPLKVAKWLFKKHSPLIIRPDFSLFQLQWLSQMLFNCTENAYKRNKDRMVRVSEYSRQMFEAFKKETDMDFEGRTLGTLQIFRSEQEIRATQKDISVLRDYGVPYQELSAEEALRHEPALQSALHKIAGALYLPNDHTGDCHLFTTRLAILCREKGAKFLFNTTIEAIESDGKKVTGVRAGGQYYQADAYVCALGSFSRPMLKQVGLNVPVYPVKGYSLTVPISNHAQSPRSTIIDETYKVAITRFNDRVRIGGMAELSGYEIKLKPEHRETLELVVNDLFPESGDTKKGIYWSGLRPMTPDSTPIIGQSALSNLYLNTGHGTLGWTMSLGSGRLLSDLISGKTPEIDMSDLGLSRYR